MCGRFVDSRPVEDLAELLDVDDIEVPEACAGPRWNIAPTDGVLAVATRVRKDSGEEHRRLTDYRWGLVPSWAKSPDAGARAFNARAETVLERPSFRTALAKRRCLVPADAFYEWQKIAGPSGRIVRRQPYCIAPADGGVMTFAGLWEAWRSPTGRDGETGEAARDDGSGWHGDWLLSCTIITTTANEVVEPLHDRMPVVLTPDQRDLWLGTRPLEPAELAELLRPPATDLLRAYPVSTAVNDVRSDGPDLVAPLPETPANHDGPGDDGQLRLLPLP